MPAEHPLSPSGRPLSVYLSIAEGTGAFRPCEIEILAEVLTDCFSDPSKGYLFLEMEARGQTVGFAVYGRCPMTKSAWDVYWIVVEKALQGQGIGRKLMDELEKDTKDSAGRAILRVETSGREEYGGQRHFYLRSGFRETGRIRDFYEEGDDLVTYCKFIS